MSIWSWSVQGWGLDWIQIRKEKFIADEKLGSFLNRSGGGRSTAGATMSMRAERKMDTIY